MASDLIFQKQTMSSLEIAELTERNHRDVMRSIREMEPAWEKVSGRKFALAEYADAQGKQRPCYELTKTECLYVATKFNDEARAKLVKRWEELETKEQSQPVSLSPSELILKLAQINVENERYKGPYKNDPIILRQLAKSMALMEAADDYFCKTLEQVSAPQNKENMLLEYLVKAFMEIRGLDEPPSFDRNLAEEILSLVADENISEDDINAFLKTNRGIVDAIRYGKSVIIQQPIIILLAYCLEKFPYYLQEKWDIDLDVYENVCKSLGYAPNR